MQEDHGMIHAKQTKWAAALLLALLLTGCEGKLPTTAESGHGSQAIQEAAAKVEESAQKISELEGQISDLSGKIDTLQGALSDASQTVSDLKDALSEAKEEAAQALGAGSQAGDAAGSAAGGDTSQGSDATQPSGDAADSTAQASAEGSTGSGNASDGSFRQTHGALSVKDGKLTDANGDPIQLYGMSTHGLAWFPQFVNEAGFRTLRDDWGINCVRLAMYSAEWGGWCDANAKRTDLQNCITNGVNHATNLGMYVIIDWHILSDGNPLTNADEAVKFFSWASENYGGYTNVLYEICNEPNGNVSWQDIKTYADKVIPVIRGNDPDSVIIVGTPCWSQEIDKPLADPLSYDNVMYTLHFYAGTHKDDLRDRLKTCADAGLPIFVSEFGMCDASGGGGNDFDSAQKWLELLDSYGISYCNWALANKAETCCVISSGTDKTSDWSESELSESGKWIRNWFRKKSFG
ncbi:MAG: cellulase family glycosylhydrolase [Lachnospiraceae bacterium]|nr:cellulase family glycosylhydrolase [Lachnospiraceae bacterium]